MQCIIGVAKLSFKFLVIRVKKIQNIQVYRKEGHWIFHVSIYSY